MGGVFPHLSACFGPGAVDHGKTGGGGGQVCRNWEVALRDLDFLCPGGGICSDFAPGFRNDLIQTASKVGLKREQ